MATKTRFQPPHGRSATNPDSASASGARCKTALAALGTTRRSPDPVSPFRGFSARTSNTPTPCHPTAPIPEGDPGNDGLGDNDNNNPDEDDPSNDPDDNLGNDDLVDKLDFPDPDTEPTITVLDNLTSAIKLLARNARTSPDSSSRTTLCEPDTVDGTDPKKLHTFFIQCKLNFQDRPWAFRTDCTKVIFVQSYLKGMALEWFELDLLGLDNPDDWPLWMDSWREFILELQTTFSPHNPVADAESQLDHLHMKESQHINKYIVDFNQLASQDEVCRVGKPRTLHELRHLAQEIDAPYWECKEEVQRASKHQGLSNSSNNKSGSSGSNNQAKTGSNNNNSGSSPKSASSKPGSGNNSNLSKPEPSKLGKDGKLTPEECKHRIDGNLCMFCGGSSHFADKCPKKTGKAKARAVATTKAAPASGSGTTPETKK
ncbi:hypothetical protein M404DRAFT_33327 [Pisolithus tinctorius Marx 270]|uniref:Retrotransposon gag domain-containing protein n=1 Tax=Pisolithus tinctorius Marx 270 TaxID=870435 RepID=A0A0C3JFI8_PISTI|nr:hypothetical protein M404DRAFT_33327 [Pisolithus tinctorius Marx 270]